MAVRALLVLFSGIVIISGCSTANQVHDPEFADVSHSVYLSKYEGASSYPVVNPVFSHLEGPHSVEEYIQFALSQNPEIQAARKRMEAVAYQVPVAASLQDPKLGVTVFPEQVQTAAGQQDAAAQRYRCCAFPQQHRGIGFLAVDDRCASIHVWPPGNS